MDDRVPLRVAIVGYGLAGSVFHGPLVSCTPGMSVAAVVTGDPGRQALAQKAFPHAEVVATPGTLWDDPTRYDLVVVATPNRSHIALAMAAIGVGLPVVIDKPMAPASRSARDLLALARDKGVPLTVFQNRRWDGDFLTVKALARDGTLGPIVRYESRFERYRPTPKAGAWRERSDPQEAGGLLYDLGSHLIDQALNLFGEPAAVYAEVNVRRSGAEVDDDTFVALTFPTGVQAHLWMNTVVRTPGPRFGVSGLRGSYVKYGLDPQESAARDGMRPGDLLWGIDPENAWGTLSTDVGGLHVEGKVETVPGQYEAFYAGVRDALREGTPMPVAPEESLRVLEIIEAAQMSARDGRMVHLMEGRG